MKSNFKIVFQVIVSFVYPLASDLRLEGNWNKQEREFVCMLMSWFWCNRNNLLNMQEKHIKHFRLGTNEIKNLTEKSWLWVKRTTSDGRKTEFEFCGIRHWYNQFRSKYCQKNDQKSATLLVFERSFFSRFCRLWITGRSQGGTKSKEIFSFRNSANFQCMHD